MLRVALPFSVRYGAALAGTALGLWPATALAQERTAVVASTGSAQLRTVDYGGADEVCLQLADAPACGLAPTAGVGATPPVVTSDGDAVGGAVPAQAVRVEVVDRRLAEPLRSRTVASSAYQGPGTLRFFLVEVPPGAQTQERDENGERRPTVTTVRAYDAQDRLIGLYDDPDARPPTAGPVDLGRVGGVVVTARRRSALAGVPAAPARREDEVCVTLSGNGRSQDERCLDPTSPAPVTGDPLFALGCDQRPVTAAFAETLLPGEVAARLVLGTGARRAAPVLAPDPSVGGPPVVLAGVGGDQPVRRLELLDGADAVVRTLTIATGPLRTYCGSGFFFTTPPRTDPDGGPPATLAAPPAAGATGVAHQLLAADDDAGRLCLTIDRPQPTRGDCRTIRARGDGVEVARDPASGAVGGSVSPDVAEVQGLTGDGTLLKATPTTGAYMGAWTAWRRLFVLEPPAGQVITRLRLLDAAGHTLHNQGLVDRTRVPLAGPTRLLARLTGGTAVYHSSLVDLTAEGVQRSTVVCTTAGPAPTVAGFCDSLPEDGPRGSFFGTGFVSCVTHQVVLAGAIGPGQRLEAVTTSGRHRRARVLDVGVPYAVVALAPEDRLRRLLLTLRGGRTRTVAYGGLPSGRAECGYYATTSYYGV